MATNLAPDPEREYNLLSNLELRIASASTDEKLEAILLKFLPALILKLASPTERNRNLAIKLCQYINQRLKINQSIGLPVEALVKTFRESNHAFVRRFCLMFIELGLPRLVSHQAVETLPGILQFAVPKADSFDGADSKMWAIAFDFTLEVLRSWKLPERGSKEDLGLRDTFSLTSFQSDLLVDRICEFLLFDGRSRASQPDVDFEPVLQKNFNRRSQIVYPVSKFLFMSIFSDQQRFLPAVILSVDANAASASMSDTMFKQCNFDLEDEKNVDALFALYRRSRPKLQTKILSILSKSQTSTGRTSEIMSMVETQLNEPNSGLEAAKLRTMLFSYLTWTVRVGKNLMEISDRVQDILKEYIELQGWPSMNEQSIAEIELRGKAYESIGLLAGAKGLKHTSESNNRLVDLATWLLTSLRCDVTRDIRSSIEEAIGRVMNAISSPDSETTRRLKDLLLWNILATPGQEDPIYFLSTVNSTKYPAVRFANRCLPFHDVDARFIDVLALASPDRREVAEEGSRGLDPYWHMSNVRLAGDMSKKKLEMPALAALSQTFFGQDRPSLEDTSSLAAAVTFCRNILVCQALEGTKFSPEESGDWKQAIDGLVSNNAEVRAKVCEYLRATQLDAGLNIIKNALHGASRGSMECLDICLELIALSGNDFLTHVEADIFRATAAITSNLNLQFKGAKLFGIAASASSVAEKSVDSEIDRCAGWKTAIGEEAVRVRGHLLRGAFCSTRMSLRSNAGSSAAKNARVLILIQDIFKQSKDKLLKDAAYRSLRQILLCNRDVSESLQLTSLLDSLITEAKAENEAAVSSLGPLLGSLRKDQEQSVFTQTLDRVFALHEIKKAEFHFALGEALAVGCTGFKSTSTMNEFDVDARIPEWASNNELMETIFGKVLESVKTTKPTLKKAAAIWLLCLIQYCGDEPLVKSSLRECQAAFAGLLNDRDEIVQETGSRGLSLVYERGDKTLQDDLVRDLVQSFTGSKAKLSGTVSEDTQLFEAGALPTENGQSVTTYKDIVSLATEMGDPSLVYRFMNLASNNAIWTSRAAFGRFGLGSVLADSSYLAENKKFYPKLYRYRFDPNPNVQRSMNEIWKALVKDPQAVLNDNFNLIMDDLLKSVLSGKEWRAREASCSAISDLIQGRDIEMLEKYLEPIWNVAFKVLDDVKETVRVAAMKLCRTLNGMLIRNLEIGEGNSKRATTMLNHAMPFLLQQMAGGSAKEVQQYAIVTLLDVIKKSPPKAIRSFAPKVLETLVVSLSSLEHESINYLHLNADKYGLTADKLDQMRVSSINASPVTEAIERCLESVTMNDESQRDTDVMEGVVSGADKTERLGPMQEAMQRLADAYRAAIGLPSKVGLSRVMITLVVRHQAAFRPHADRFIQLTRKHIIDRNATISVAFSTSLGYLMRLASDKEVLATSKFAQKLYFESQELMHRSVAGEILQAISKAANDVFMNSASVFLPFAFIGRQDTDAEVKERFEIPWKENIGGSRAINLYLREIIELVSAHIKSPLWPIKHACCFAVAELVKSIEVQEEYTPWEAAAIWNVMQDALDGKTWEGKSEVVSVYPKFVRKAKALWADKANSQQMKKIALREAKRNNVEYRPHSIAALGDFAVAREDLDLTQDVIPYLVDLMDEFTDQDAMDVDETNGKSVGNRLTTLETTASSIVSCLFKTLSTHASAQDLGPSLQIVQKAHAIHSSAIDGALYEAAKFFAVKNSTKIGLSESGPNAKGCDKENPSASVGKNSEVETENFGRKLLFEPLLLEALGSDHERQVSEPEALRKSRVALAAVLAEELVGREHRQTLTVLLDRWSAGERSRPLREDIDRARLANAGTRDPGPAA